MRKALGFVAAIVVTNTVVARAASAPADDEVLGTLRPGHPRLMVLDEEVARVRRLIATNADVRRLRDALHEDAVKILDEEPVEHKLIGPRMLDQSRTCLRQVSTLAAFYRLEGDRGFARWAEKQMLTAAAFPDWNPSHFLDTAEMTNALAIGYDWLYDVLSPESRRILRTAIMEKGLKPGLAVYRRNGWWSRSAFNWNQVCNGGMTAGALAIADEEPAIAAEVLSYAGKSIPLAMASFAPDGGWAEGPSYWNYATRYTAYYWAAVTAALGQDFGLGGLPGFAEAGLYRIQCVSPAGLAFNYADGGATQGSAAQMMYFARRFDRPVYAFSERQDEKPDIFDLLWYDPRGSAADLEALPTAAIFRGIDVVYMRSRWNDPHALFVGFKGGDNRANHGHLDLGTFVLDALGERWAVDLGPDNYNLPGYFDKDRWNYYRLRTEGHNTLLLDGVNQNLTAKAPIVAFEPKTAGGGAFAVADLSSAYAGHAGDVRRGVALLTDKTVLIEDEIKPAGPAQVRWAMHTSAAVEIDGRSVTLSMGHKTVHLHLLEPAGASWRAEEVRVREPQNPVKNTRRLSISVSSTTQSTRIAVLFSVHEHKPATLPVVISLSKWSTAGMVAR